MNLSQHKQRLRDLVENKNILLVGNSNTVTEKDNGELIDSYEFVIRFNLSIAHYHHFPQLGTKCDAWIYAMSHDKRIIQTWNAAETKPLHCIRYGPAEKKIREVLKLDVLHGDDYLIDDKVTKPLIRKELNIPENPVKHPTTGFTAIWYFLKYTNPKSISLIGFDSFKTHNFYTNLNNSAHWHDYDKEREWIANKAKEGKINLIDS